ncbi:MAG: phosphatase PAP2 family protein [Candidatus Saccharimonadales bacterium]
MNSDLIIRIMADGAVVPIILIGAYVLVFNIPKGQRLNAYKRVLLAGLTTYLIAKLIGAIYQPSDERPFEALGAAAGASFLNNPGFPSDHAIFITSIAAAVWFETKQKWATIVLVGLVVVVCVGRVLALVHTPADVIGGIIVALVGALWYLNEPRKKPK